jgi:hypothetical protein
MFIVLVGEGYLAVFKFLQPVVGDGHPVGITTQVIEDSVRATEWRLGIDEMRRSIPEDATLWVIKRIHSVQLEIRRSTLEKE